MSYTVGQEFVAKSYFPPTEEMLAEFGDEEFSYDVHPGEVLIIESINEGIYKMLNLSMGHEEAWFKITEEELIAITQGE